MRANTIHVLGYQLRLAPFPRYLGRVWTSHPDDVLGVTVSVLHKPAHDGTGLAYRAEMASPLRTWSAYGHTIADAVEGLTALVERSKLGAVS